MANSNNVIRSNGINWSINQIRNRDWLPFEGRIRSRRLSGYVLFMIHFQDLTGEEMVMVMTLVTFVMMMCL